ncbi:YxcD family protein [Bacillus mobilis]|uniref:YxcD family protein n=1 Tax=Bacillus mobilis TaxID=2026190 RepID=UPI002E1F9980|nr:YxcD family protein [Bacillus mobilis]MED0934670.1 YxcD family protein [Bacillus mobilis]MED0954870.1 YxcD family protein [Bacillus mobilis]
METIKISEQELINALCVYIAEKRQVSPEEVLVELMYDDDYGFSAEVEVNGRKQILIQANLIEALRLLLDREYNVNSFAARLQLELDDEEGIYALAKFNNSEE